VKDNLNKARRAAVTELKYGRLFPIQALSIPYLAAGNHLVGQAPGGAGKTIAFCLGLLAHMDASQDFTQGLIVGMTRELAIQIYEEALVPLAANHVG